MSQSFVPKGIEVMNQSGYLKNSINVVDLDWNESIHPRVDLESSLLIYNRINSLARAG